MNKYLSLKKNAEFKKVYDSGKYLANDILVLYYLETKNDNRIGISVSKKVGNSVIRHKVKRRIKEAYRNTEEIKQGYDLVFIARKKASSVEYKDIKKAITLLFRGTKLYEKNINRTN